MAKTKQNPGDQAERELRQALLDMPRQAFHQEICPSLDLLERFVAGSIDEEGARTQILAHLGTCPKCLKTVVQLRNRRLRIRKFALGLVAAVLIATVLWIWPARPSIHSVTVAIVDLSDALSTR